MLEILDEISVGKNSSNGALSTLWCIILRRLNIEAHQWEKLLSIWCSRNILKHGESAIYIKKNNLVKSLAAKSMTWKTFLQGLQIINASNRYKCIRLEVHLIPKRGNTTEVIGLDIYDRTQELSAKALNKNDPLYTNVPVLSPGMKAKPGKLYRLEGLDNRRFNNAVVECTGIENITIQADSFNGCTAIGSLLLDPVGIDSKQWIMHTSLASVMDADAQEDV